MLQTGDYAREVLDAQTAVKAMLFPTPAMGFQAIQTSIRSAVDKKQVLEPPFPPSGCAAALLLSGRLSTLVGKMARLSVGLGTYFDDVDELPGDDPAPTLAERRELKAFFRGISYDRPFTRMCETVAIDRHATGNGYYEIVTNRAGAILRIVRAWAVQVRKRADGQGFVRFAWEGNKVKEYHFKHFGDLEPMDRATGAKLTALEAKGKRDDELASEMIQRQVENAVSLDYGVPWWIPEKESILTNLWLGQHQQMYVLNAGCFRYAVIVENGELDAESVRYLRESVIADAKNLASGGIIVLQASKKHPVFRTSDVRIRIQVLGTNEDPAMLQIKASNNEALRETSGMSGLFLGAADALGRAAAGVGRQMVVEQTLEPLTLDEEFLYNERILPRLGAVRNVLKFNRPRVTDNLQDSQIFMRMEPSKHFPSDHVIRVANRLIPGINVPPLPGGLGKYPFELLRSAIAAQLGAARAGAAGGAGEPAATGTEIKMLADRIESAVASLEGITAGA